MVIAYIRVSTEEQSCSSQEYEIRHWAAEKGISINKWEKESVSGTVDITKRKLGKLIDGMSRGDTLVSTEISRLGRNMLMIMSILNECTQRGICIHTIKDHFDLDNNINSKIIAFAFALAAEIERNLISQRTKEALADKKAAGVVLGRPKGSSRKKDNVIEDFDNIRERRKNGESIASLARSYGVHRNTMKRYIDTL